MSSNHDNPTSCTASNRPPDGPAVGADSDRSDRSDSLGRRTFVKGLGASTVAAVGLATGTDSADAFVISGTAAIGLGAAAAGAAGGAGLAYLARNHIEGLLGESEDLSGYTGADALKTQIRAQATQMLTVDERVMTSIENNLANSETVAFAKGKAAAITEMNAEAPEADAVTAMETAVDDYYSTVQKNIVTHVDQMASTWLHHLNMVDAHADLSIPDVFYINLDSRNDATYFNGYTEESKTATTLNGDTIDSVRYVGIEYETGGGTFGDTGMGWKAAMRNADIAGVKDPDSNIPYMDSFRAESAFGSAASRASTVKTKLEGFVSDLYAEYGAGDIPTEDVIDPVTAATQLGQNTGMAGQAAEAAMLGIPTSASFSLWLELQDADGNTTEVEAEMYTTASPTDGSGNETGWEVGTTYDPANFDPPIYVAYEYIDPDSGEKSSDFIELDHPFTVIEATDAEGNEVMNVQNEERITQTADVTKLEEELQQLRDEQQRLQEEAQSAGGFSFDSLSMFGLPGEAIALGGAAVVSFFALGD